MAEHARPYLGFMLDVSRHFMPVEDILKLIDAAEVCGLNTMHWHLTDDQSWRIEIKKYPALTETGSRRGASHFGRVSQTEHNCGYYTQEQIRQVVAYAGERGINIVPEIEVPGHASAMLAAYPQFGCRRESYQNGLLREIDMPYEYDVMTIPGIFPNLICAGKEESLRFLEDILDEVAELFPGPYVHIGGDEALKLHWRRCPDCQKRIREEGLADEEALQRWLVLQIGEYLGKKGKKVIVYNECLSGGMLPEYFIVQHWLGNDRETAAFLKSGGKVIRSDTSHYYFDYPYSTTDAYDIWSAPEVPDYAKGAEENLLGMECMLWTERIPNLNRAAQLLFPRVNAALLKATAKPEDYPSWESFSAALEEMQEKLAGLGLRGGEKRLWRLSPEDREADRLADEQLRATPEMEQVEREERRLLLQEELEKLLRQIGMPRRFSLQVMDQAFRALPGYCGRDCSEAGNGSDILSRQLLTAVKNREDGPWAGIPQEIWLDTMKCFTRFVTEHHRSLGYDGFDRGFWTTRQIGARLFRIGQLEYELVEENGRRAIGLHIPSDTHMDMALLDASVEEARAFLRTYFPDWAELPMECETWLLSPALVPMLPPDSNILRFQKAFDITSVDLEPMDVLEWVFRLTEAQQETTPLESLPEDTTLQKNLKAFLLSGGKVGTAAGRLTRRFYDT